MFPRTELLKYYLSLLIENTVGNGGREGGEGASGMGAERETALKGSL